MTLSRPVPYEPIWWQENTAINVNNLDTMDYGTLNAYYQSEAMWLIDGKEEIVYSGDNISEIRMFDESDTLRRRTSLNYSNGDLQTIDIKVYEDNGTTIFLHYIDSLSYNANGDITKVSRSVQVMPEGV